MTEPCRDCGPIQITTRVMLNARQMFEAAAREKRRRADEIARRQE